MLRMLCIIFFEKRKNLNLFFDDKKLSTNVHTSDQIRKISIFFEINKKAHV